MSFYVYLLLKYKHDFYVHLVRVYYSITALEKHVFLLS